METELSYVLLVLIAALGLLLVVFVMLYLKTLKTISILKDEIEVLKKDKTEIEKGVYEPVNSQAKAVIDAANKKASEIIASVQGISEQQKSMLYASFQQVLNSNLKEYQAVAGKFSQTYENFVSNIGRDVKARLDMGLNKIVSDAQTEMKRVGATYNSSLQNLYNGYEAEVSNYKKEILSQIEKLGVDIIKQVSLKVLGRTMTKKEQEELVIKSLEEAKKLGFFE